LRILTSNSDGTNSKPADWIADKQQLLVSALQGGTIANVLVDIGILPSIEVMALSEDSISAQSIPSAGNIADDDDDDDD